MSIKSLGSYILNKTSVHTYELNNEFKVTLIPTPSETVAATLVNKFGSASEHVRAQAGSLHLLEHLYFRVGKNFQSMDNSPFSLGFNYGCYQNAETSVSSMNLVTHGESKYQEEIIKNFSERCQDNFIDPAAKACECEAVYNEAQRSLCSPWMQTISHLSKLAMSDTGYSEMTIGTIEDVANVTAQELMELKAYFSKPSNMHIVLSGAVSDVTLQHVQKHFGAIPPSGKVNRPGLKPQDPQVSQRSESIFIDGGCMVCAVGYRSPDRKPYEFTEHDVLLRVVDKALKHEEIQKMFPRFASVQAFNPEYCAPYLFSILGVPQPGSDPGMFSQLAKNAMLKVPNLDEQLLKSMVRELRYDIETAMNSAHSATNLLANAIGTKRWQAPKEIHECYCKMIKGSYSIQNALKSFIPQFFADSRSSVVIGIPKQMVNAPKPAPLLKEASLKARQLTKNVATLSKIQVVSKNHNMAVVQKVMPSVLINASIPFSSDIGLHQEAAHKLLANILNARQLPPNVSTSTRRQYASGHDVFHISMKVSTASALKDIMSEFKKPNFKDFGLYRDQTVAMIRGENTNASAVAKILAINSVYSKSPFTQYMNLPDRVQNTELSTLQKIHQELLNNLPHAQFTFTGDWTTNEQSLGRYKSEIKTHFNADFKPIQGNAMHRVTGEKLVVDYFVPEKNKYSVGGELIDSHLVTKSTVAPFQWTRKSANERLQRKNMNNIATATIMMAVSFPKHMKNAMTHVMSHFGDSMSGLLMQKIRWIDALRSYGINSVVVGTNATSDPLAVVVGTVGSSVLEDAQKDIDYVFENNVGKLTQKNLDTTHQRMVGERAVKGDFSSDLHEIVHGKLVEGENPTLDIPKPTLEEFNEASKYLMHMARVEIVPTRMASSVGHFHSKQNEVESEEEYACVW